MLWTEKYGNSALFGILRSAEGADLPLGPVSNACFKNSPNKPKIDGLQLLRVWADRVMALDVISSK
ncbi:MAG: hypothetical protein H5T34_04970 [Candidatus Methanomethyliales bacterium]|nr:hypothetical protein [Candidatus Methanomethylicales archaeon]